MGDWDEDEIRTSSFALQFRSLLERIADVRPHLKPAKPAEFVGRTDTERSRSGSDFGGDRPRGPMAPRPARDRAAAATRRSGSTTRRREGVAGGRGAPEGRARRQDARGPPGSSRDASLRGVAFDTQIAAYLLDPAPGRYELADCRCATSTASCRWRPRRTTAGPARARRRRGRTRPQSACAHAAALLALADRLSAEIDRLGMAELIATSRCRSSTSSRAGADRRRDRHRAAAGAGGDARERIAALETPIYELAGGPFNLNSPPQLRDDPVRQARAEAVPPHEDGVLDGRGDARGPARPASDRGGAPRVPRAVEAGRTYLERAATARRSRRRSRARPVQADGGGDGAHRDAEPQPPEHPGADDLGREIRRAFVAGFPDHVLLVADYSQIELRVLAHITGDPGLREAFERDEDVHAATAAKVWGSPSTRCRATCGRAPRRSTSAWPTG